MCSSTNRDTDIECRSCAFAPWKQEIIEVTLPVVQNQAIAGEFGQPEDSQHNSSWTCRECTLINELDSEKCTACENPRPVEKGRRSPCLTVAVVQTHSRAPSPGKIVGTVSEATQTEGDSLNPAQKVLSKISQLVKYRKTSTSSRDASPQPHGATAMPLDSTTARWTCRQCKHENSMDRVQCDHCGYEEETPLVKF